MHLFACTKEKHILTYPNHLSQATLPSLYRKLHQTVQKPLAVCLSSSSWYAEGTFETIHHSAQMKTTSNLHSTSKPSERKWITKSTNNSTINNWTLNTQQDYIIRLRNRRVIIVLSNKGDHYHNTRTRRKFIQNPLKILLEQLKKICIF